MNKPDGVSKDICATLRAAGCAVTQIKAASGQAGVPDLLVSFRGRWYVLELKTPKGKLSPAQQAWHTKQQAPVFVVRTPEEALTAIGLVTG